MIANSFLSAYAMADSFGKLIFWGLFCLSMTSWVILVHKFLLLRKIKQASYTFASFIKEQKDAIFHLTPKHLPPMEENLLNPFVDIYFTLKLKTKDFLEKNHFFIAKQPETPVYLSRTDVDAVQKGVHSTIQKSSKQLEKHLFILSTIVTLAPFLGLLGTVWGILVAFNELQGGASLGSSTALLGGLSTALTTTVLGLLIAIPALVGYNYLKNSIRSFTSEMELFSSELISRVELHYRQVDVT